MHRTLVSVALLLAGCQRATAPEAEPPVAIHTEDPVDAAVATVEAAAPLSGHDWLEPVGDDARELAKVSVPQGATNHRPLMIALHGAGDRSEWSCGEWRGVTRGFPFIVCPRGDRSGFYYDAPKKTEADLQLAIGEVRGRFDGWVEPHDPEVLAGFSMGATEAIALIVQTDLRVPSVALVEGGYDSLALAGLPRLLAARGVERVLLACTTLGYCPTHYADAKRDLARAGIEVHFVQAGKRDHGMYADVIEALALEMPWLEAGRAGFEPTSS